MPVPASVKSSIKVASEPPPVLTVPRVEFPFGPAPSAAEPARDPPTPRLADGKPDLSGNWMSGGMNWR
jgi:hypothetical protein